MQREQQAGRTYEHKSADEPSSGFHRASAPDLAIYPGSASRDLVRRIAARLNLTTCDTGFRRFPDTELFVQLGESARGRDAFVVQSTSPPVNEHLMELLIIIDALRRASAGRITAVIPYYGYARQEQKHAGREPITAKLVADLLVAAGATRVMVMDLHAPAIQGFFNIGMDHLTTVPLLAEHLAKEDLRNAVVVSPDVGRVKMADHYARLLDRPLAIIHKRRLSARKVEASAVIGEVRDRDAILIDDMISTGGTIRASVEALLAAGARPGIRVVATHGLFVPPAAEQLDHPAIAAVIVTDTIAPHPSRRPPKLVTVPVDGLLADAILRTHCEESVSALFPSARERVAAARGDGVK